MEKELAAGADLSYDRLLAAKRMGYTDRTIAELTGRPEAEIKALRRRLASPRTSRWSTPAPRSLRP